MPAVNENPPLGLMVLCVSLVRHMD